MLGPAFIIYNFPSPPVKCAGGEGKKPLSKENKKMKIVQKLKKGLPLREQITPEVRELMECYLLETLKEKYSCRSSKEVFDYLYVSMRDLKREVFKVIFLNSQNRIESVDNLFTGSLNSSSVYPREIIKTALEKNAAAMIFAHNHPSGIPTPSDSDKSVTENLVHAGQLMEIKVLDHIVVGDNRYFSFADCGLIKDYEINGKFKKPTK